MKKRLMEAFERDLRVFARAGYDRTELRRVANLLAIGAGDALRLREVPSEVLWAASEISTTDLYSIVDRLLEEVDGND